MKGDEKRQGEALEEEKRSRSRSSGAWKEPHRLERFEGWLAGKTRRVRASDWSQGCRKVGPTQKWSAGPLQPPLEPR